jgi:hypothetical protein
VPSAPRPGEIRANQQEKGDIRTEATPTSKALMIMGLARVKRKERICLGILGCAQIVSKNHQEYQNVSKNIELHRSPGAPQNAHFTAYIHYFLRLSFFRRFLHTVKGRAFGSPLARVLYPRASTAEVDPRSCKAGAGLPSPGPGKTGAPAAVEVRGSSPLSPTSAFRGFGSHSPLSSIWKWRTGRRLTLFSQMNYLIC